MNDPIDFLKLQVQGFSLHNRKMGQLSVFMPFLLENVNPQCIKQVHFNKLNRVLEG